MMTEDDPSPRSCMGYTAAVGAMLVDEVSMVVDEVSLFLSYLQLLC
jgi:hypothetical protein